MENSAFVPNTGHMNSPALVVFSQAAGTLTDGLRLQRPFNSQFQMGESSKDLHRPFTATTFGLRNIEAYGGLQAHILNHLQPQFLHPGLTLGSSAFRPLSDLKSFSSPSAFAPPKCLKIETSESVHASGMTHHGFFSPSEERYLGPSPRMDSCSPASASMSPQPHASLGSVKEESLDAQISEDGETHQPNTDSDSPGMHEESKGFRIGPLLASSFVNGAYTLSLPGLPPNAHSGSKSSLLFDIDPSNKKRKDPSSCPVCGISIPPGDLETHFMRELDRLYKLNGSGSVNLRKRKNESSRPAAIPGDSGPDGRWETFQRIKTNRQGRLKLKIRKRKLDDGCPVCTNHFHKDETCLRKPSPNDEDETVDVEGYSELEDWNEARKRNSLATVSADRTRRMSVETETEDLIVDGDEPEDSTFPPKQHIETSAPEKTEEKSKQKEGTQSQVATVNSSGDVEVKVESGGQQCDSNVSTSDAEPSSRIQMIEELRSRIRQLEAEGNTDTATSTESEEYKCLICLEHYKKPVISTVCWHVHCEECWLHTLGSKKVCPQCGMITSPSDLRRIFM